MVLAALCYMFFKAVYTPPAYLSIAKGDSKIYLVLEVLYNIVFMVAVVGGFHYGGLLGAGVGLTIANLYDLLAISIFYSYRYKYRMERATLCRTLMQFLLLASTIGVCVIPNVWVRYGVGVLLLLASLGLGYKVWRDRK
jgi:O-antigen/teichoic acid export membrane protein